MLMKKTRSTVLIYSVRESIQLIFSRMLHRNLCHREVSSQTQTILIWRKLTGHLYRIIWENDGDEEHFWLNGYVNKQNCRIWNEANPQVYVETPLHPEKLTVWCALWAGGILLQKR
ncbi:DUF4817 domain-containing protein [Trichonephila clavipes]|nr:DUF4817 domain-containing protein [Trichonephila clavipes]